MTNTTYFPDAVRADSARSTFPGPIVAAVGGVDPDSVLRAARVLEHRSEAGVLAVAVLKPIPASLAGSEPVLIPRELFDEEREYLRTDLGNRLREFGGSAAAWTPHVVEGAPAPALIDFARAANASLLVMGLGRHHGVNRLFGNETTLQAIRLAGCPVLAVHAGFDGPFHDVVVATDFSPASAFAAQSVLPLLAEHATLHLLHVCPSFAPTDLRARMPDEPSRQALPARFARFQSMLELPAGVEVQTIVRDGKPAEAVLEYAEAHRADLVVAGRHGLRMLARLLLGSQTTALLRGARCSLLVAPEPPVALRDRLQLALEGAARSEAPGDWEAELQDFSRRNAGRTVMLDVEDLLFSARLTESGFVLRDTSYDSAARRIELVLDDAERPRRRVTRVMGTIHSLDFQADKSGRDLRLQITHGGGSTALNFV